MTVKRLKELLSIYQDEYEVIVADNVIQIKGKDDEYINSYGGVWEGGTGWSPDGNFCGECSHFNCEKCSGWNKLESDVK